MHDDDHGIIRQPIIPPATWLHLDHHVAKLLGAVKRPSSFPSVDDLREMGY